MKLTPARLLWVAVAAGALGLLAGRWWNGNPLASMSGSRPLGDAVATSTTPGPAPPGVTPPRAGDLVPPIRVADLQGHPQALPGIYAGRPMLINVWASWCGPCLQEMPELDRYARTAGHRAQIIGLALDTPGNVQQFLQRVPVAYPVLIDTPGPADASVWLGNTQGVLPYSVLVSADGRVVKQKTGRFAAGEIAGWVGE